MDDKFIDKDMELLRKLYGKDFERMRLELIHFQQTNIPRCPYCKEDFVHGVDSIACKVSKYLWIPNKKKCDCFKNRNFTLSVG